MHNNIQQEEDICFFNTFSLIMLEHVFLCLNAGLMRRILYYFRQKTYGLYFTNHFVFEKTSLLILDLFFETFQMPCFIFLKNSKWRPIQCTHNHVNHDKYHENNISLFQRNVMSVKDSIGDCKHWSWMHLIMCKHFILK